MSLLTISFSCSAANLTWAEREGYYDNMGIDFVHLLKYLLK